jgi:hypothetical protein
VEHFRDPVGDATRAAGAPPACFSSWRPRDWYPGGGPRQTNGKSSPPASQAGRGHHRRRPLTAAPPGPGPSRAQGSSPGPNCAIARSPRPRQPAWGFTSPAVRVAAPGKSHRWGEDGSPCGLRRCGCPEAGALGRRRLCRETLLPAVSLGGHVCCLRAEAVWRASASRLSGRARGAVAGACASGWSRLVPPWHW